MCFLRFNQIALILPIVTDLSCPANYFLAQFENIC